MIGQKILIYSIDKADKKRKKTRNIVTKFFKNTLGFKDENIVFVDRTEFEYKNGVYQPKFSSETKEKMNKLANNIFSDRNYGFANQILNIAICET